MKELLLIRHAKSSWEHPELSDHDRPLNTRGLRDLPRMARRLQQRGDSVDCCWSSTATRALTTANTLAQAICTVPPISRDRLYTFDPSELLHEIQRAENSIKALAVVGHNPAIETLTQQLLDTETPEHFPTCSMVRLRLAIKQWGDLHSGCAELLYFDWPKRLPD